MKRLSRSVITAVTMATVALAIPIFAFPVQAQASRVQITGEIIDTFCSVSEVMFAAGSAHYQCAVWCAVGGIPVSIKDKNGDVYMILRIEEDDNNVANPKLVTIQAHEVTVDGELIKRDGVNYLLVSKVATDKGIINLTHDEHGILPFGN